MAPTKVIASWLAFKDLPGCQVTDRSQWYAPNDTFRYLLVKRPTESLDSRMGWPEKWTPCWSHGASENDLLVLEWIARVWFHC